MQTTLSLYAKLLILLVFLTGIIGYHYAVRGFNRQREHATHLVPAARAERGPGLIQRYGCVACHTVPGVPGAVGKVGPPLDRVRDQGYIAGVLPTSPQNLIYWLRQPREADPRTAMPNVGVTQEDARDIAAFLLTLP